MRVTRTKRHVLLKLTVNQADALYDVVRAANQDGDHEDWLKHAGNDRRRIKALRDVMQITHDAMTAAWHSKGLPRPSWAED